MCKAAARRCRMRRSGDPPARYRNENDNGMADQQSGNYPVVLILERPGGQGNWPREGGKRSRQADERNECFDPLTAANVRAKVVPGRRVLRMMAVPPDTG